MIHTADLEKILGLALLTAHLEGERPLSIMLVSDRPGGGKSELALKFNGNLGIEVVNVATRFSLVKDYQTQLARGEIRHFLFPEFLSIISNNRAVAGATMSFLQMLMEEGVSSIHSGALREAIRFKHPACVGVIACLPRPAYLANRMSWMVSGLLSRFLVVSYSYGLETVEAIFNSIGEGAYRQTDSILMMPPDRPLLVDLPGDVAAKCLELTMSITESAREQKAIYGFRELKHVREMVMAHVLWDNQATGDRRAVAAIEDFDGVAALTYLFNEQFNPIGGND